MAPALNGEVCVAYLDDITLSGSVASLCEEDVLSIKEAVSIGLVLNPQKSEIISDCSKLIDFLHGIQELSSLHPMLPHFWVPPLATLTVSLSQWLIRSLRFV